MANPSVTYTFLNTQTSDGPQVSQNFTDLINAMTDGTKDFSIMNLLVAGTLGVTGTSSLSTVNATGVVQVKAGSSSGTEAKVGGVLYAPAPSSTGNSGASETDLLTYTIPASTLATNGDSVRIMAGGTFANTANNKIVRLRFGGTAIFTSTTGAFQNSNWAIEATVTRVSSGNQRFTAKFWTSDTVQPVGVNNGVTSITDTASIIFKVTGTSASTTDDVVGRHVVIDFQPNNT